MVRTVHCYILSPRRLRQFATFGFDTRATLPIFFAKILKKFIKI